MSDSDYFSRLHSDESFRREEFPVAQKRIFLGHAGVTILPRRVVDAMNRYTNDCCYDHQEFGDVLQRIQRVRHTCADLIGATAGEIALLGPTSLGLSLFANGLTWNEGDEILCYKGDYPANVYPWMEAERRGAKLRFLEPDEPGAITPELVEAALTPRTKLVALASCHFLTGYRIDTDAIGKLLREREILFSLDAIQTVGAFETKVEHVDFLSADSHKWMLGPASAGIVFVREENFERLRPTLLGAWNVKAPNFIVQDQVEFHRSAIRYEPGVLNLVGAFGMAAALELLLEVGIERISRHLLGLKAQLVAGLDDLGYEIIGPRTGPAASSITTVRCEGRDLEKIFNGLTERYIIASHRHDRQGREHLRFSPHLYNTEQEIGEVLGALKELS
ncbi:MAG: aminotransferase class V-fold PLP-dependent enzyme [Verrucomicrobiales bacterium]